MKIKLPGIAYIEDLVNIKNRHGQKIRKHLLYRSANLAKSKDHGKKLHDKYQVKYVVDFRTDHEINIKPEKLVDEIQYYHIPLAKNDDNPTITKENRLAILKQIVKLPGGAKEYMRVFYPTLVNKDLAIDGYKKFFKILLSAKEDEAVLFHCTQGKDRTGVVLLLLLSIFEVDKEVIIREYMNYNHLNWLFNVSVKIAMTLFKSPRLAVALDHILSARRVYIETAFNEIEEKYQSVDNYIRNIIGLSDDDIKLLRHKYLY